MKYKVLFSIGLHHDFFADQSNTDQPTPKIDSYLELIPDPETVRIIQGHRFILKKQPGKIICLAPEIEPGKLLIPIKKDNRFRFYLRIKDAEILNFTTFTDEAGKGIELNKVFKGIEFPKFSTQGKVSSTLNLTRDNSNVETEYFNIEAVSEPREDGKGNKKIPFFLSGDPIEDKVKPKVKIVGEDDEVSADKIELDIANRAVNVEIAQDKKDKKLAITYRAIPPWASQTFGLVDITAENIANFSGKTFLIKLTM